MKTRQTGSTAPQAAVRRIEPLLLSEQVTVGQRVYDTQGAQVGKVAVRFPLYLLIERGWIFPQVYYVLLMVNYPSTPFPGGAHQRAVALAERFGSDAQSGRFFPGPSADQ